MGKLNIDTNNILYGLLLSDFDNIMLYRYFEYKVLIYSILQEKMNENPNTVYKYIEMSINEIKLKIAENNRLLRDLDIEIENFTPEKGQISIYTIKKNNLMSVNEKSNLFIDDLKFFKNNYKPVNESKVKGETFDNLFKDPGTAKKVKEIFETKGYTLNGKWQGLSGNKGELLSAYYILKPLLKPHKITPVATIFYKEFGLTVERKNKGGYISPDMLRKELFNNDRDEFEIIFASLIK